MPGMNYDYFNRAKSGCCKIGKHLFIMGGNSQDYIMYIIGKDMPLFIDIFNLSNFPTLVNLRDSLYLLYDFEGAVNFKEYTIHGYTATDKSTPTRTRIGHKSHVYKDKMYVFGGVNYDNSVIIEMDIYDFSDNTLQEGIAISGTPRAYAGSTIDEKNGVVYFMGGMNASGSILSSVDIYNIETNTLSTGANIPSVLCYPEAQLVNKRIYLLNGIPDTTVGDSTTIYNNKVYKYNTLNDSLKIVNSSVNPVRVYNNSVAIDGTIYIMAGKTITETEACGFFHDDTVMAFSVRESSGLEYNELHDMSFDYTTSNLNHSKSTYFRGVVYDAKLYVASSGADQSMIAFDVFDLVDNTLCSPCSTSGIDSDVGYTFVGLGDKLYKFGGANSQVVKIYDVSTNILSDSSDATCSVVKTYHESISHDGKIYSWGGDNTSDNVMYIYDISTNVLSTGTAGGTPRSKFTMQEVNGYIYIFGGHSNDGTTEIINQTVDIYSISDNTWSTGTSYTDSNYIRYDLNSSVYENKIYIYGGINGDYWIATTNIYDTVDSTLENGKTCLYLKLVAENDGYYGGRSNPVVFVYNGYLYIYGGRTGLTGTLYDDAVIVFDILRLKSDTTFMISDETSDFPQYNGIDLNIDSEFMSISNDTYTLNPTTGTFSKIVTNNTPTKRFGHGVFKVGSDSIYSVGGALDKTMIDFGSIPFFTNEYTLTQIKDTSGFTDYINSLVTSTGSYGLEYLASGTDFGDKTTSGENGYYVLATISESLKVKEICIEGTGGNACRCVIHSDTTAILYDDVVTLPIILDITDKNHYGSIYIYLDLVDNVKIKNVLILAEA